MKKALLALVAAFGISAVSAQNYVHRVVVLNEGYFDYFGSNTQIVPVTVGVYNPATKNYSVIDTIENARFGSDVKIYGNKIYVAADSLLLAYDKDTYALLQSTVVKGVRKMAFWNNRVLVTRGDVTKFNSYFQIYDTTSLVFVSEIDTISGPKYASEGVAVVGDSAYVAINNGYDWGNEVGKIGSINLSNQSYFAETDLGVDGKNPDNLMVDNGKLYTLNNKDFATPASISSFDISSKLVSTKNLPITGGCGTSAFAVKYVYYQEFGSTTTPRFDVTTETVVDTIASDKSFYGLIEDKINSQMYATTTDFFSFGKMYMMSYNGVISDSVDVGVSPGNIALDIRSVVGISENSNDINSITVSPNPTKDKFQVLGLKSKVEKVEVYNLIGEKIQTVIPNEVRNLSIDLTSQPNGIYFLNCISGGESKTIKIVKQ